MIYRMRCDVWWARPTPATARLMALLSDAERERFAGYRQDVDKLRFLTGRTLIRAVAGLWLGVEPEAVVLDSSCYGCGKPHGKPRVVAKGAPRVSISHSGDLVALAAVDGAEVGIDVEQIRDTSVDDLARMSFSVAEKQAFDLVPLAHRRAAFFTYWARKEAVVKATGKGMSIAMSTFTLAAHDAPAAVLASESPEVDPSTVRMTDLEAGEGYRASLAVFAAEAPEVTERQAADLIAGLG